MAIGIYKITNQINGKIYIGQSTDIKKRWTAHKNNYNDICSTQYDSLFYKAIRKYGLENFTFEIIEECKADELNEKEIYWIKYYDSFNIEKGYNMTKGGQNAPRFIKLNQNTLSEIIDLLQNTDMLLGDIAKKYNISNITVKDINQGYSWHNDNLDYPLRKYKKYYCHNCGKEISNKATYCLECFHIKNRKVKRPDKDSLYKELYEVQGNFAEMGRRYDVTDNTIRKWCKWYNISCKSQDYKNTEVTKKVRQKYVPKKVNQYTLEGELINTFNSPTEASRAIGKERGANHISNVCKGKRKTAYGYKWEYA